MGIKGWIQCARGTIQSVESEIWVLAPCFWSELQHLYTCSTFWCLDQRRRDITVCCVTYVQFTV